jgi:alcohol dehydrogenase (cytochrome c)
MLTAAALCSVAVVMPAGAQELLTQERLNNADLEPQNWLMPGQNYGWQRYSRLDEINQDTIGDLRVAYTIPLMHCLRGRDTISNRGMPLVDEGFMFFEGCSGFAYKIELQQDQGIVLWTADVGTELAGTSGSHRGSFMYGDSLIMAVRQGDDNPARVVRVSRDTGEIIYDVVAAGPTVMDARHSGVEPESENFTSNPMVMENIIVVGNAAGDAGTRGWLQGHDFETGEILWRFYTVPGPGEFGHETWADEAGVAWRTGGGSIWTSGSYDPEQRLFIQGTAQPVPMFDPEYRPGDNLFTNSAIALHIETGELAWYFQYTPNESWDYDEQGIHMLVDAPYAGVDRQMLVHFGRNGFAYQLDRTSGEFINAAQYVEQVTWTAGIDEKTGLPIEFDPNLELQVYIPETRWARGDVGDAKIACPQLPGGVRWQTPALNPDKMIAYVSGEDGCQVMFIMPSITMPDGEINEQGRRVPGGQVPGGLPDVIDYVGLLAAVDLETGQLIERVHTPFDGRAGVLATAGGLIFTSWGDGSIVAYDDETLQELWRFQTGMGVEAPISSFEIGGKQYLAAFAGDNQSGDTAGENGWGAIMFMFALP